MGRRSWRRRHREGENMLGSDLEGIALEFHGWVEGFAVA